MPSQVAVALTVADVVTALSGHLRGAAALAAKPVRGGYASDLLSDVIANAEDGDVWITMQKHLNTVAVAQLKNVAAIVIVNGREPDPDMVARAAGQGIAVVVTPLAAFDAAGILYSLGLRGRRTS